MGHCQSHNPIACAIPPHIPDAIRVNGTTEQRAMCDEPEAEMAVYRAERQTKAPPRRRLDTAAASAGAALQAKIEFYDVQNGAALPGTLARNSGSPKSSDRGLNLASRGSRLVYRDQSGALDESFADVFGTLVEQRKRGQTADKAYWLIGAEIFAPGIRADVLRSIQATGTAFDDPTIGRDPQPFHMNDSVVTSADNGGVHINSGIANHAFYLLSQLLGGKAWKKPGRFWYDTMQSLNDPHGANTQDIRIDVTCDDGTRESWDLSDTSLDAGTLDVIDQLPAWPG